MLAAYAAAPDAFTSTPEERRTQPLSWWARRVADPLSASQALGVWVAGKLVGTVAVERGDRTKTRHKAHLLAMYVRESHRGQGVGRALVAAALAHARTQDGLTVMTLTVTEGNAAAIALYEAAGFRPFGTEPMAIRTPTGYRAKVHMWRALDD